MTGKIEIMDTTLRDGEQTDGVSFSLFEKKQIAHLLLETLKVDRIEIASARVTEGEQETAREIIDWARGRGFGEKIEILGFVDGGRSLDWIGGAGGRVINLLTKGSRKHCEQQLGKSLTEHLNDIEKEVGLATSAGIRVNVYLEDWSNGVLSSPDYVHEMITVLRRLPIHRFLLPDTLGVLSPMETGEAIARTIREFPGITVDFHGHNDYDLVTANCLAAAASGASGIHTAINGLGERAGNAPLESVVTALHDKLGIMTGVNEKAITDASRLVEAFSGKRIASNRPIVGQDVYTQTAGIHADGDKKNNLYANPILPERFGRVRIYALGKLSGRASITNNLKLLGLELPRDKEEALLQRVKDLGEQQKNVTIDDLPFLIDDLFGSGSGSSTIRITEARVVSSSGTGGHTAELELEYNGVRDRATSTGAGGYDAFMRALRKITERLEIEIPRLTDYEVRIPPGGKTDALVEVIVTWEGFEEGRHIRTAGVDSDQVMGAIKATERMLNLLVARKLD